MILWAACFPLITIGLLSSPHLTFAAMLYPAQASSIAQAARQLQKMKDQIQGGGSPFYYLK